MDWLRQFPIGQYVDEGPGGDADGDAAGVAGAGAGPASTSWLKRLDPRLKLLWTLAFLMTPILAGPCWRLALVGLLLLITLASGLPSRIWRRTLPLLIGLALLIGLLAALLPTSSVPPASLQRPPSELRLAPAAADGTPAQRSGAPWELLRWGPVSLGPLPLGPLVVTRHSAELGLNSATLIFTLIHSANLLLLTTSPEQLVWAISWCLSPLGRFGYPTERLGFTLLLSLRFLPLVQEELQNLLRSIATRALNLRGMGWKRGLGLVLAVGERLLANVLLRAEQGAEALLARGGRCLPADQLHQQAARSAPVTVLAGAALAVLVGLRCAVGAL